MLNISFCLSKLLCWSMSFFERICTLYIQAQWQTRHLEEWEFSQWASQPAGQRWVQQHQWDRSKSPMLFAVGWQAGFTEACMCGVSKVYYISWDCMICTAYADPLTGRKRLCCSLTAAQLTQQIHVEMQVNKKSEANERSENRRLSDSLIGFFCQIIWWRSTCQLC